MFSPTAAMASPSERALSTSFMKAPLPHLMSSARASSPSASFLLMMLAVISGTEATVAVTSRRA